MAAAVASIAGIDPVVVPSPIDPLEAHHHNHYPIDHVRSVKRM
jgi:hypothetical protein